MLKKIVLFLFLFPFFTPVLRASPPSFLGEDLLFFGHPDIILSSRSSSGGLFFNPFAIGGGYAGPSAAASLNPALVAGNQRFSLDFGYTGVFDFGGEGKESGESSHFFRTGALLPTHAGVFSADFLWNYGALAESAFGRNAVFTAVFARDVTPSLYVGASFTAGFNFNGNGKKDDYALFGRLGFIYKIGNVFFLRSAAFSASLSQIGKTFNGEAGGGSFPPAFTPEAGFSASFLEARAFSAGFSLDARIPSFYRNAAFSGGLYAVIAESVFICAGAVLNAREMAAGNGCDFFAGIKYNLTLSGGGSGALRKGEGWKGSGASFSAVWQNRPGGLSLISAGATLNKGERTDEKGPSVVIEAGSK
ncbi:MAG: hypothetical protein LBC53_10615 [Spirochaetaceae bacterium]|nr:hypothetical protein [Spirochaetaceae bacterium]